MGFGDAFAQFNLAPGVAESLDSQYGAPTPDEMQRYGAKPDEIAAAQRFNAPGDAPPQAATNPVAADPKWDPTVEARKTNEEAGRKERAAATPQGPAGPDGFPTYRDLGNGGPAMRAAPGGPVRYTHAGWQNSARSESKQHTDYDPEMLESSQEHRDASAGESLLAADKHLEAAQIQAQADAAYATAHAKAADATRTEMARIQVQREQYVQAEQSKLADMAQAAQKQVDPEAAKGSSGAQLMAAIGIALGQYGASITGGTNAALQIVQSNIDRNIAAQQANIANAGKAHDREASLYRQNLEAFGDKERATLATKVAYLDQAKAMADQQYALAKGSTNEGQYHDTVAGIEGLRAKYAEDFAKLTGVQVATQGSQHWQPAQAVGGAAGQKGKEKLYVPSLGGYARDEESARKLNAHGALRTQINEDIHEMHSLLETSKGLNSVSDYDEMQKIRQRIDQLKHGVLQKTTVLADQGAMSNGDKAVAEARSGLDGVDPQLKTDAQINRAMKGLAAVARGHQRDARLEGESYGIQLGREGYVQSPNGPEARAELAGRNKVVTKKTEGVDDLIEKPKGKPVE